MIDVLLVIPKIIGIVMLSSLLILLTVNIIKMIVEDLRR